MDSASNCEPDVDFVPRLVGVLTDPEGQRKTSELDAAIVAGICVVILVVGYPLSFACSRRLNWFSSASDGGRGGRGSAAGSPPASRASSPRAAESQSPALRSTPMPPSFTSYGDGDWASITAAQVQAERDAKKDQYFDIRSIRPPQSTPQARAPQQQQAPNSPRMMESPRRPDLPPPPPTSSIERFRAKMPSLKMLILTSLWLGWQLYECVTQFLVYEQSPLTLAAGYSLPVARAAGGALRVNCLLVMLPMMHWLNSKLRGSLHFFLPTDIPRRVHKLIGFAICFWTAVHMGAHIQNYNAISALPVQALHDAHCSGILRPQFLQVDNDFEAAQTEARRFLLQSGRNISEVRDPRDRLFWWAVPRRGDGSGMRPPTALELAFMTWPGLSGHILTFVMVLMISVASRFVRNASYELFWYVHHVGLILFYALLITHALAGMAPPESYKWVSLPLFLYLVDRCIRIVRGYKFGHAEVVQALQHPSNVLEVRMSTSVQSRIRAGQYVYICCPVVSRFEWHPFTATSSPDDDHLAVHLRVAGDWTAEVASLLGFQSVANRGWGERFQRNAQSVTPAAAPPSESGAPTMQYGELPPEPGKLLVDQDSANAMARQDLFLIDGGYGAPADRVFDYDHAILVGGGIGVTPFVSILRAMRAKVHRLYGGRASVMLRRCDFFWVCKDFVAFEFFWAFLLELERDPTNSWLHLHIYFTSKQQPREMREMIEAKAQGRDGVTALQARTHFGRPVWNDLFSEQRARLLSSPTTLGDGRVGVFVCGPKKMTNDVFGACSRNSCSVVSFKVHAETF